MNIELIVVGKTDSREVEALVDLYVKRVNHYTKFVITTIPDLKNSRNLSTSQQRSAEGELIM
ncbi:MAG: 23S rRNA (pseudouridine(1915)-N(3))-methyltransferase RlmH, partial [Rikenellaceae bacterium]